MTREITKSLCEEIRIRDDLIHEDLCKISGPFCATKGSMGFSHLGGALFDQCDTRARLGSRGARASLCALPSPCPGHEPSPTLYTWGRAY